MLLKLNAGGFFDLKDGQSGQAQWDFLEHYIININISKLIIILMTFNLPISLKFSYNIYGLKSVSFLILFFIFKGFCVLRFVFCVLCFMFYVLCFMFYVLYFIFYVLCFMFYVLYFVFDVLCFVFYVLCFMFCVLCFVFYVLCFVFYVLCFEILLG